MRAAGVTFPYAVQSESCLSRLHVQHSVKTQNACFQPASDQANPPRVPYPMFDKACHSTTQLSRLEEFEEFKDFLGGEIK